MATPFQFDISLYSTAIHIFIIWNWYVWTILISNTVVLDICLDFDTEMSMDPFSPTLNFKTKVLEALHLKRLGTVWFILSLGTMPFFRKQDASKFKIVFQGPCLPCPNEVKNIIVTVWWRLFPYPLLPSALYKKKVLKVLIVHISMDHGRFHMRGR